MNLKWNHYILIGIAFLLSSCKENIKEEKKEITVSNAEYVEKYRPQFHFSPKKGWLNDPNGLVYNEGVYHLFYQYYPNATVWGPMHWGHAISKDMLTWEHKPIALFPDEKGMIFSGSAVVDSKNTSGFGKDGKVPLVAIFTYHLMHGEKNGGNQFQTQGVAYSLDNGTTWTKYQDNPVIGNNGIRDLRDPKVFWHSESDSWIMALVAGDHAKFYRSKNLKNWDEISDFGMHQGSHGGVWECPDLFKLKVDGTNEEKWVLIISIGNGGPNGGSATQYFIGDFDGTTFTSNQKEYKWLDWGTDNYAGVTYNNTPKDERIFIGWMSNWQYALTTPTSSWRSAMTLPRKLTLKQVKGDYVLHNAPLNSIESLMTTKEGKEISIESEGIHSSINTKLGVSNVTYSVPNQDHKLSFYNNIGERTSLIYDASSALLMLDRTQSGETDFNYDFGNKLQYVPLKDIGKNVEFSIFLDKSSIEVFVNKGQYVITAQLFPTEDYSNLSISNLSNNQFLVKDFSIREINSIWD